MNTITVEFRAADGSADGRATLTFHDTPEHQQMAQQWIASRATHPYYLWLHAVGFTLEPVTNPESGLWH